MIIQIVNFSDTSRLSRETNHRPVESPKKVVRVLIADDSPEYCSYVELLLKGIERSNYQVDSIFSYSEAQKLLMENRYDVYLIDYKLDSLNGLELIAWALQKGCTAPIILMTGINNPEVDTQALEIGAADYLSKEVMSAELLNRSIRYSIKQAETVRALKESQNYFSLFMQNIPCAVSIKNQDGRYVFTNRLFKESFSHNMAENSGTKKTFKDGVPEEIIPLTSKDKNVLDTQKPLQVVETLDIEGDTHYWLSNKFPIPLDNGQYMIGKATLDITEQVTSEQFLRQTLQILNGILSHLPVIAARVDKNGKITEIKGKGLQRFGLHESSLIGYYASSHSTIRPYLERALAGESVHFTLNGIKDGVNWHLDSHFFFDAERGSGAIYFGRDITDQKNLEKQVLEISSDEQQRIGIDLHDGLGQHLTGIACLCSSLQDKLKSVLKNKNSELIQNVATLAELIQGAIYQTRSLARGLCPVQVEKHGLASALEELSYSVEKLHSVKCHCKMDTGIEIHNHNTALHLYRIAQEAINNSLKHANATQIIVSLHLDSDENKGVLRIEDNGQGFSESKLKKLSLGLNIMKYRSSMAEGNLMISSDARSGTRVECVFNNQPL